MTSLVVADLSAGYGSTEILHNLSLEVAEGEVVAVLGRNGVGKTTLLRTALGYLPAMSGSVMLGGNEVTNWPTHRIIKQGIGYAGQDNSVFIDLTVGDNLEIALRRGDEDRLKPLLALFPRIRERYQQRAGTLSGGEQKILLMTRTLASARSFAVFDEISEGVQPSLLPAFQEAIRDAVQRGVTVLLTEQNLAFALGLADRFYVMSGGLVVDDGVVDAATPERVRAHLVL